MIDSSDRIPGRPGPLRGLMGAALAVALAVAMASAPTVVTAAVPAALDEAGPQLGLDRHRGTSGVDGRWLPWLGCWKLSADAVDYREVEPPTGDEAEGERLVCMSPRLDGAGVGVVTLVGQRVVLEDTLVADGERRPFETDECRGWQETRWSRDGQRLFVRNEVVCGGEPARSSSGVSFIADRAVWVDVQLVGPSDQDPEGRAELLVKRYVRAGAGETIAAGLTPLRAEDAVRAATARASAAGSLDVADVVGALEHVDPEVVEALILESQPRFDIDADTLGRLAAAEVPPNVIDLMIAVSYPEDFIVDRRGAVDEAEDPYRGRSYTGGYVSYPHYYGYSPFLPFYSPFHGFGTRVFFVRGGRDLGRDGSLFGGRVVQGRGYTSVRARQQDSNGSFLPGLGRSSGGGGGSSVGGDSGSGGGSVTPEGHRGGGTRKAKPRGGEEE